MSFTLQCNNFIYSIYPYTREENDLIPVMWPTQQMTEGGTLGLTIDIKAKAAKGQFSVIY